jgi:hypothetical protein
MTRALRSGWLVVLFVCFMEASASAQMMDLSKALVGKWDGEYKTRGRDDPNRTLIIKSVTERDGKWFAEGLYGITGKGLGKVMIDVDASGRRPSIQFTTGANSVVRLELFDAKSLVGTLTLAGSREGGSDRGIKLNKVE